MVGAAGRGTVRQRRTKWSSGPFRVTSALSESEGPGIPLTAGQEKNGRSGGARNGSPKANEMVQWTISSDERPERKRRAGNPANGGSGKEWSERRGEERFAKGERNGPVDHFE